MLEENIDMYYVSSNDFHNSEYASDFFKCREFISGFDGSAGSVVISMNEAGLWTDGRYFIQAEKQLAGSGITLYKAGLEGVPRLKDYIFENMAKGQVLGFDGRTVPALWAEEMSEKLLVKGAHINSELDLVGDIWQNRPNVKANPVMLLDICYAGETREHKIAKLRKYMKKHGANYHIVTSLDDIAWLLNIRGSDIRFNPVVLSYLVVGLCDITLFAHKEAFSKEVTEALTSAGVSFEDYGDIYTSVKKFLPKNRIMLDKSTVNCAIVENISPKIKILDRINPSVLWKAVKNSTEVENIRKAHIKDGVAVTKFIYWLKKNIGKIPITELYVTEKLEELRSMDKHYIEASFDTIAGFGAHGAIVHYSATKDSDVAIEPNNLLLVDSGGHYLEGTTDVTRTIWTGGIATDEQKRLYTAVLCGNLSLCDAHFIYGCSGTSLDYIARKPLWDMGYDYNHGTGHGVGYLLNVHESPNAFRMRILPRPSENVAFEEGMVTSDEPGVYIEGKFGIRLENLILCVKREKTPYGQFMGFEPLTFVPFEMDLIDTDLMDAKQLELLKIYHKNVYENISPHLDADEREWLAKICAM